MITMIFDLRQASGFGDLGVLVLITVVLGVVVTLSFGSSSTSNYEFCVISYMSPHIITYYFYSNSAYGPLILPTTIRFELDIWPLVTTNRCRFKLDAHLDDYCDSLQFRIYLH